MDRMSQEEYRAFLSAGTRTGKLATVRADGRPHVVPIWFVLDEDDTIVFTTWHTTVKAANLWRDPRVSMCVGPSSPSGSGAGTPSRANCSCGSTRTRSPLKNIAD